MLLAVKAGIVIVFLVIVYSWIRINKNRLNKILNLSVEFAPKEINRGETVNFYVHANPSKRIKADRIEGDLICRRNSNIMLRQLSSLIPSLKFGEITQMLIFNMGSDLIFMEGSDPAYPGYLPIPEDADATMRERLLNVEWTLTLRVYSKGYPAAEINKELVVHAYHPMSIEAQRSKEESKNVQEEFSLGINHPHKTAYNEGVINILEGDKNISKEHQETDQTDSSRFSFLELESNPPENTSSGASNTGNNIKNTGAKLNTEKYTSKGKIERIIEIGKE